MTPVAGVVEWKVGKGGGREDANNGTVGSSEAGREARHKGGSSGVKG